MRHGLVRIVFGLTLALVGCSGDEAKVEEPVQPAEGAAAPADQEANDAAEAPDAADADMSAPSGPAPQDNSQSAPAAQQPVPQPSGGGIISSGVKPIPGAECKGISKFSERKKCFEKAQKAAKP